MAGSELKYLIVSFTIGHVPYLFCSKKGCHSIKDILESLTLAEKNNIKINREHTFSNGKRIDILINVRDTMIIAIENKVFSSESDKQTEVYEKSIYEEFPDHEYLFLFLTPNGKLAQSENFKSISYKQLVNQLKQVEFDYRRDIRRKIIFDEFILHVEEYMMNKKSKSISDQTKLYLEYQDTIKKLSEYYKKDSLMVFEEFEGILKNFFGGDKRVFNIKQERGFHQVYKKTWNRTGLFIHHEFWISSEDILSRLDFEYMIEVEGKEKENFFSLFQKEYEKMEGEYRERGISYRPDNRKIAIAYKRIDNYFRPDYVGENKLIEELEHWKFIESAIDRVHKEFLRLYTVK
ncbi:PD-(D/E)XK nuclease superfamily protein [Tindallia californiensis]|uniref:PD-(D/E)XK nuclease superfamily protein n=1 Tax=Tindallia californiensis TaxID=159292 RepID=A0A1H3RDW1_9FIRM|nr:PD-(D/E)XK nuclease superfamily protein [Tindallia californiensis]